MIKSLLAGILTLPVFILTFFLATEVKVTQQAPSAATPNGSFDVRVTINKGDISGFAKYQLNVPQGVSISEVASQGATFTFNAQQAKFIWLSLPETPQFTITYKVTLAENAPSTFDLKGAFSYLENNERKSVDVNFVTINVSTDAVAVAEETKLPVFVDVQRSITALESGTYKVEINITKQSVEGFGKLEEFLPQGAAVEVLENNHKGVFTYLAGKAKFVWVSLPVDNNFKVAYKVDFSKADQSATLGVNGEFSYLVDNQTAKLEVTGDAEFEGAARQVAEQKVETIPVETLNEALEEVKKSTPTPEVVAENKNKTTSTPPKATATATNNTETVKVEELNRALEATKESNNPNPITNRIPAPETGIKYRVQIVAGHKLVNKAAIAKTYNYQGDYYTENHEGWIKYTVGGFGGYQEARNEREKLTSAHPFPEPFVAAYNNGERITVQEALMISNQSWVK